MARKWAIGLTLFGLFVVFLVVPGTEVGHGNPPPGDEAITFLRIWWVWWWGISHRTAVWIAYSILGAGTASLILGLGGLAYQRWKR